MTEREARIAFNLVPEVGSATVGRLAANAGGSAVEAWERFPDKRDWQGRPPAWEREIERAAKMGVTLVTELDAAYPERLKKLSSPPLVLYVSGEPAALAKDAVALVGTRAATSYGLATATRFAASLARAGWAVYSGLALGIDAAAHEGALAGGGVTAGVLGGALDRFFPKENARLARSIVDAGGAVVSEFPFGRSPDKTTFPQRNRIVAALSRGVVAVECPRRSGTLITCSLALDMGIPVMAVPGRLDSPAAGGSNQLIRDGARLVTSVDDVLEEVNALFASSALAAGRPAKAAAREAAPPPAPTAPSPAPAAALSLEEALVLRAIPDGGATIDAVARQARLPVAKVNAILVQLRLKRRARFAPGNRVVAG